MHNKLPPESTQFLASEYVSGLIATILPSTIEADQDSVFGFLGALNRT